MSKGAFTFNSIIAVIGATITHALGGWDVMLQIMVSLIALDYILGVSVAIFNRVLNSDVGFKGLFRKMVIFALVYLAVLLDRAIGSDFIRSLVILFYIANEGISVLENAGKLGVPYPPQLKDVLIQLRKKVEEENHNEDNKA